MDNNKTKLVAIFFILSLFSFSSCFKKEPEKGPFILECKIVDGNAVFVIDKTKVKYNRIESVEAGPMLHPEKIETTDSLLLITAPTENLVNYIEGHKYDIRVSWFGGRINAKGIYNQGKFEIVDEWLAQNGLFW